MAEVYELPLVQHTLAEIAEPVRLAIYRARKLGKLHLLFSCRDQKIPGETETKNSEGGSKRAIIVQANEEQLDITFPENCWLDLMAYFWLWQRLALPSLSTCTQITTDSTTTVLGGQIHVDLSSKGFLVENTLILFGDQFSELTTKLEKVRTEIDPPPPKRSVKRPAQSPR